MQIESTKQPSNKPLVIAIAGVLALLVGGYFLFAPAPEDQEALYDLLEDAESLASSGDAEGLAELTWPESEREAVQERIARRLQVLRAPGVELIRLSGAPSFSIQEDFATSTVRYRIKLPGDKTLSEFEATFAAVKRDGEWYIDVEESERLSNR